MPAGPLLGISTHIVASWGWLKAKDFLWTHCGPALPPANHCAHTFSAPRAILVRAVSPKAPPTVGSLTSHLQIDLRVLTASALCWGLTGLLTAQSRVEKEKHLVERIRLAGNRGLALHLAQHLIVGSWASHLPLGLI